VRGTLVETLGRMQLPELAAFASQIDLVAAKGVAGAQLMDAIAIGLAREYRRHVLRAAEELESNLVIPAAAFFFLPFVIAIMVPLLLPLLAAF
jgi:tight adherence protein C